MNFFLAPRPICLTPGLLLRLGEKFAAGPYVEGCTIPGAEADVKTGALGGALVIKINGDVMDSGFSLITIASLEYHAFETDRGSSGHAKLLQTGQYIGYQQFFDVGFNFWLGIGALYIAVLDEKVDLAANETADGKDDIDLLTSNRFFPFPGLLLSWAF